MSDLIEEEYYEPESRGARRRARTRLDLLAAARKVFAERGYHEASIADITSAADVGVGTFYLHFRDKDAIFNTLIEEQFALIRQRIVNEIRLKGSISPGILISALFQHAYEDRDVFRLALTGGSLVARRFRAQEIISLAISHLLEDAHKRGILPWEEEDIPLQAHFIMGMILQGMVWWFDHEEPEPEVMAEQVIQLLAHGLPAGIFEARPINSEQIDDVVNR